MNPNIFPKFLIVLDLAAAAYYTFGGDYHRAGIYWVAAGVLTAIITD